MKINSQRLGAVLALGVLLLGYFFYGRGDDPRSRIIGVWKVNAQSREGEQTAEFALKVDIKKDGTFVLTGNRVFEAVSGTREIRGRYRFITDNKIRVEMDTKVWDYQPTVYVISEISRSELSLNAEDYSVSLKRAD